MSRLLLIRSIPLSLETRAAWQTVRAWFTRRNRLPDTILALDFELILNLGNSYFDYNDENDEGRVWNLARNIGMLRNPAKTREYLGAYLPPIPDEYSASYWVKGPGRGGMNKSKHSGYYPAEEIAHNWDIQEHINGQEYRIITVGERVVQQHKRLGLDTEREYHWLPKDNLPKGLRPMVKSAAKDIEGLNVIAWDTIINEEKEPFILEGNTSPGVNHATAQRILTEMSKQHRELTDAT